MDAPNLPEELTKSFEEWINSNANLALVTVEDTEAVLGFLKYAYTLGLTAEPKAREAEFAAEITEYKEKLARLLHPEQHRLVSLNDGVWTFKSPIFPIFVETMAQMLDEFPDAKNYLEFQSDHEKYGPLVHVIQKVSGKTPGELKNEAEDKLRRAKQILKRYADGETGGALANAALKELG